MPAASTTGSLNPKSPFDFERWAVSLINARPNQKQVGDKGIDGIARFPLDGKGIIGRILASVQGGKQLNPSMVRDLASIVHGSDVSGRVGCW